MVTEGDKKLSFMAFHKLAAALALMLLTVLPAATGSNVSKVSSGSDGDVRPLSVVPSTLTSPEKIKHMLQLAVQRARAVARHSTELAKGGEMIIMRSISKPTQELSGMRRLNKALPIPLYHQLKEVLLDMIRAGEWKPSEKIPTEDELARQYEISKTTVRLALRELETEGFVRREQGRGTFVAIPKIEQGPRDLTSFTQDMQRRGAQPSSKVLNQEVVEAKGEICERLHVREGDKLFRLRRLRLADGEPMGIQTAYIPLALCPNIEQEQFEAQSLYRVLEERFGLVPASAQEHHWAVTLEKGEARWLKVPPGSPALSVERVTFLPDGRPMELAYSVMRGDRYTVTLHLRDPRFNL